MGRKTTVSPSAKADDKIKRRGHPSTKIREMRILHSPRLPFRKSPEMNFMFTMILGAAVYGGATLGECYYAANKIKDGNIESWVQAFNELAVHVERQGRLALSTGHRSSARDAFFRAANYYWAAAKYTVHRHPGYKSLWQKSRNCMRQALILLDIPGEAVHIPYYGRMLPGYFLRARSSSQPRSTLIAVSGFDSTAEELYFIIGAGATRRGYNVLVFEGPGQRGVMRLYDDLPFRPDYEDPIRAAVDYALSRPEVDAERLVLFGFGFGGHLVLRGAAYDQRVKALIADTPLPDFGEIMWACFPPFMLCLPPSLLNQVTAVRLKVTASTKRVWAENAFQALGVTTISDYLTRMKAFKFTEPERITCPTLCFISEGEGAAAIFRVREFYNALRCPKRLHIFTAHDGAEAHGRLNNIVALNNVVCDWLDETLS